MRDLTTRRNDALWGAWVAQQAADKWRITGCKAVSPEEMREWMKDADAVCEAASEGHRYGALKRRPRTVREACRDRQALNGADAQALEHALTITEQERDSMEAKADRWKEMARGTDLPTVLLRVGENIQTAEDHGQDWDIVAAYDDDKTARLMVALDGQLVAEVTVHLPLSRDLDGHTIIDEAQAIGAAILWSAMRAEQIRALPPEAP